jgi:hypothetical protein
MENKSLEDFWTILEFRLSGDLYKTDIQELKGFWCDGIYLSPSDHQLKRKYINDNRKIHLTAWLGKTGQEEYDATIFFGSKAQSLYARNLPLVNSLPEDDFEEEWFLIDTKQKTIEIILK